MAKILNFSNGVQEYDLNGAIVRFNGTDYQFAERLVNTFDRMEGLQQKYKGQLQTKDGRELFKACRAIDREMRDVINDLFADDVADKIFGTWSCYALADGLPVWANLLFAVMDEIDDTIISEQKKTNPRLDAYLAKYKGRA